MKLVREAFLGLGPETLESAVYNLGKSNLIVIGDSQTPITVLGIDGYLHENINMTRLNSAQLTSECNIRTMARGLWPVFQAHCITEYEKNHWQSHDLIHRGDYLGTITMI